MPCPNCSVVVVTVSGFPEWCPQCDWNVDPAEPPSAGPHRRAPVPPAGEQPAWDAARLCSYALACGVHVFAFGPAAGGLALAFLYRHYVVYALAAASVLIAFAIRPRAEKLPENAEVLTRTAAPGLHALV